MSELSPRLTPVFAAGGWARSTFCGPNGGNCVEVNRGTAGLAGVRDSKPANSAVLIFAGQQWQGFVERLRSGEFGV